ncbi:MAG TPA: NUDIX domain-containing protein [Ornithinimicrobium sp.]|uniref:NUDIX hydrolase n=1 Tax=Ornithinimicrobium sp. TaxID=1977084 RepID=UPI002B45CA16|nr:NUDIX domain-containing protein [Ornithinimicrobium sp.]HKJ12853.1 NUDIX domain-containing protein [Ornithinimicrobium sp.]
MRARVEARDASGAVRYEAGVAHGEDPARTLAIAGWEPRWLGARLEAGAGEQPEVVLRYAVEPQAPAYPYQRLAAYALVTEDVDGLPCVLLTSFTDSRSGHWGLPGGGIDDGEDPVDAVHREVWEETGQLLTDVRPHTVTSGHWAGRAPSGRFENFHAVRLVYRARCPRPQEPVVHDVGGSTEEAAWVPLAQLGSSTPLQPWGREVLAGARLSG